MVIVFHDRDHGLVMRQPSLSRRLVAFLCAEKLDRELADGASPDAAESRALRADFLVRPALRHDLADRLASVVNEARGLSGGRHPLAVPIRRRVVRDAADLIQALIERLVMPAPVPAQGVALVHQLLSDGSGPLYASRPAKPLTVAVQQALDALDPLAAWG